MKIRSTLDKKSLKFQLSSCGFTKKQIGIVDQVLKKHKEEILTKDELQYIIGLLEQEYNGLAKCETYEDEYNEEKDMCDNLLKKLG